MSKQTFIENQQSIQETNRLRDGFAGFSRFFMPGMGKFGSIGSTFLSPFNFNKLSKLK